MLEIGPIGPFLVAVFAIALAAAVGAASAMERPPAPALSRAAVVLAGSWAVAFVAAGVLAAIGHESLAVIGLLIAAAELAGAAAIWFARSRRPRREWGDGGSDDPDGPSPGGLPEDYWRNWETELRKDDPADGHLGDRVALGVGGVVRRASRR